MKKKIEKKGILIEEGHLFRGKKGKKEGKKKGFGMFEGTKHNTQHNCFSLFEKSKVKYKHKGPHTQWAQSVESQSIFRNLYSADGTDGIASEPRVDANMVVLVCARKRDHRFTILKVHQANRAVQLAGLGLLESKTR